MHCEKFECSTTFGKNESFSEFSTFQKVNRRETSQWDHNLLGSRDHYLVNCPMLVAACVTLSDREIFTSAIYSKFAVEHD